MPYQLCDDVSYCQVDGHLIFLDIDRDRYFRLSDRLERVFVAHMRGDVQPITEVNDLLLQNILIPTSVPEGIRHATTLVLPSHSALEYKAIGSGPDARALAEVFATVCSTKLQLRIHRLKHQVQAMVDHRQRRATCLSETPDSLLLAAADTFIRARRYVPIESCCLLDSLSMIRFLSRRQLFTRLVFGVTQDPFAAHCWVQAGDWVLNDTVGSVIAHTPIREV